MKTLVAWLLGVLVSCCSVIAFPDGETANSNEVRIVWSVPTNSWPSSLWTYRVVPQSFSPAVISNLMALGKFTERNRTNIPGRPPFNNSQMSYFSNEKGTRYLGILQPLGWIYYKDEAAESLTNPICVPNDDEALQLANEYLRVIGIDRSQLSEKSDGFQLRVYRELGRATWLDEQNHKEISATNSRGVYFIRRIDGVDFIGLGVQGGVFFNFGNNAQLIDLKIVWKGLEPSQLHKTLDQHEFVKMFAEGRGKWNPPLANLNDIKKITITRVAPYYRGVDGDDDEATLIKPFAFLTTIIDYGNTHVAGYWECQILSTALQPGKWGIEPGR